MATLHGGIVDGGPYDPGMDPDAAPFLADGEGHAADLEAILTLAR
jgi:hypothetical protein